MIRKALRKTLLAGAAGLAFAGFTLGGAQAADTIKVGTFLSVTGPASFLGDPELKTLQMMIQLYRLFEVF